MSIFSTLAFIFLDLPQCGMELARMGFPIDVDPSGGGELFLA